MENFINPFYTIRIFDRHEIQEFYKGGDKLILRDKGWKRFNRTFNIHFNEITDYRDYVLFEDSDDPGTRCIKITFVDQTYVYGAYSWEAFDKWMNETYIPLLNIYFKEN